LAAAAASSASNFAALNNALRFVLGWIVGAITELTRGFIPAVVVASAGGDSSVAEEVGETLPALLIVRGGVMLAFAVEERRVYEE
jgi:hypothetical protein